MTVEEAANSLHRGDQIEVYAHNQRYVDWYGSFLEHGDKSFLRQEEIKKCYCMMERTSFGWEQFEVDSNLEPLVDRNYLNNNLTGKRRFVFWT